MRKQSLLFLTVMSILLAASVPNTALGTVRYVARTTTDCGTLSPCYTSIQTAINNSVSNDSIQIQASDSQYVEKFSLPTNLTADFSLSLYGTETARTVISGGGSGTVITADNPSTAVGTLTLSMRNITIQSAAIGIQASNKTSITVSNSVFQGLSDTAVNLVSPQSGQIHNNTFYNNTTAVNRDTTTPSIKNNIFSDNTAAWGTGITGPTNLSTNNYFNNGDDATTRETTAVAGNPLFVDTANGDFHLKTGSPCIDTGDTTVGNDAVNTTLPDIGAYGGPLMDTVPFPLSDLAITGTTSSTISLQWSANNCYLIGGYKVSYGSASGTYTTTLDAGNVTTYDITGLSSASPPTGAPVITRYDIASNTLVLYWDTSPVSGETGYEVRYDTSGVPTPASPSKDAGNSNSYPLTGLTNYMYYYVNVTAYAQSTFYIAVQAYYSANPASFVSDYSNEVVSNIGTKSYSATSSVEIYDYPEPLDPNPNLKNTGCFIATAAYGHYSAPQVQALRDFRDEYLLTNAPGRAFVRWYYEYGPIGAEFIDAHPWLKPVVRTALLPAVGGAVFMTRTTGIEKAIVLSILMIVCGYALYYKKKLVRAGGRQ